MDLQNQVSVPVQMETKQNDILLFFGGTSGRSKVERICYLDMMSQSGEGDLDVYR